MATGGRGISRTIVVEVITARLLLAKFHEEVSTFSCNRCAWIEHCSTGASEVKAPPWLRGAQTSKGDAHPRCPYLQMLIRNHAFPWDLSSWYYEHERSPLEDESHPLLYWQKCGILVYSIDAPIREWENIFLWNRMMRHRGVLTMHYTIESLCAGHDMSLPAITHYNILKFRREIQYTGLCIGLYYQGQKILSVWCRGSYIAQTSLFLFIT